MSQYPPNYQYNYGQGHSPYGNYGSAGGQPGGQPPPKKISTMAIILIVLGIFFVGTVLMIGLLVALLIPSIGAARSAALRMEDQNNLKQIALAFHNYHDVYKKFPAPAASNAEGVDVWSWRVALLPFLEKVSLYQRIDFKEMKPWNDPINASWQAEAPSVFRSERAQPRPSPDACHVFVISAPTKKEHGNPIFIDGIYTPLAAIRDGTSNTILAIQLANYSVPWASPNILTVDEAYRLIQQEKDVVQVAFADGAVVALPVTIDRATFDALVSRDGGEVVDTNF